MLNKKNIISLSLLFLSTYTFSAPNPASTTWVTEQLIILKNELINIINNGSSTPSTTSGTPCTANDMRCAIFATRTLFQGDMTVSLTASLPPGFTGFTDTSITPSGALSRATQICNTEGAILSSNSVWKPWISFSSGSGVPSSSQNASSTLNSTANYYRPAGAGWIGSGSGIIAGNVSTAFLGDSIDGSATQVYTGTDAMGEVTSSNCNDWITTSVTATKGFRNEANERWTAEGNSTCNSNLPVYCVQQVQ